MAHGGSNNLPNFDDVLKRGSATEPRSSKSSRKKLRPSPKVSDSAETQHRADLSLNHAVDDALRSKYKSNQRANDSSGEESACRRRTPMTLPRTRVTAETPLEQRLALKNLKQKLFDDTKQVANKASENNVDYASSVAASDVAPSDVSDVNMSKVKERLNQVRDYLTQATSMYVSLSINGADEPQQNAQMSKLAKLIQQLRIQEKGYLNLIQKSQPTVEEKEEDSAVDDEIESFDVLGQQQELQRLREQQGLLRKIVEQQRELEKLKEKQSTLMHMQENAEQYLEASRKESNVMNNQRSEKNKKQNVKVAMIRNQSEDHQEEEKKISEWENKFNLLQEKKQQMDQLLGAFKTLKNSQDVEVNMLSVLNGLKDVDTENTSNNEEDMEEKIARLDDVKSRMSELKELISGYEQLNGEQTEENNRTEESRDNRIHAKAMQEQSTITGSGGARLRIPSDAKPNRPTPKLPAKNNINSTKKASVKNTNQEKINNMDGTLQRMKELQKSEEGMESDSTYSAGTNSGEEEESTKYSTTEDGASELMWQESQYDKIEQLKAAKQKLYDLQQLVRGVQDVVPTDDLENLSEYGESEEEGDVEEEEAGEEDLQEHSPENKLSDNERRFQGLLRKQRLELNYLLKERERLLETQQKLSSPKPDQIKNKDRGSATLTKEKLKEKPRLKSKKSNDGMSIEPQYGSERDFSPTKPMNCLDDESVTHPLNNPLAVTEIRRQRELFEQRKKQKFVEKQRRKKLSQGEEGQSDDRATYSVHSDLDEGVGGYSADVTTAATWGGSTEQSSDDDNDSAVGAEYPTAEEQCENEDEYDGSQFDQVEEEEEMSSVMPPIFKKFPPEPARRGITWEHNDITPTKKRKIAKKSDESRGQVSWSLDVSPPPPQSKKKLRQGNLTPAHKLIQDCKLKRQAHSEPPPRMINVESIQPTQGSDQLLNTQLVSMCNSLLKNEQTLLNMLQNQNNNKPPTCYTNVQMAPLQEFFEQSNYKSTFEQTLSDLRMCYERVQQHQADMEYLHHQFNNPASPTWPPKPQEATKPKDTQTDVSIFEDMIKTPVQPFTLFGEPSETPKPEDNTMKASEFMQPTPASPGVVGDRPPITTQKNTNVSFPYRLRMSDYNPLSYQGNFPNTYTGNVTTMSRMSMKNKNGAVTNITENEHKTIWPSFFKMDDPAQGDAPQATADNQPEEKKEEGEGSFPLFEQLRNAIYAEVATLIAMNEQQPHYLIELFRELQLLNTDYLRQRGLYALQELVTRFLTEEKSSAASKEGSKPSLQQWVQQSGSEQTPSGITTDDEGETQALKTLSEQMQNNELYDYAEVVEGRSGSVLSTPQGSSLQDLPFASDDLGNTVINLDDALQKMKLYEQQQENASREDVYQNISDNAVQRHIQAFESLKQQASETSDVTSEVSSDLPQPSVDTQLLDAQIKRVMSDLVPYLNANITNMCTQQLLENIRVMIVQFAKRTEPRCDDSEHFSRFFHTQLDSILKDSLAKFESRRLKECGEDILVDVSEILFNELAFFKLMRDLDRPTYGATLDMATGGEDPNAKKSPLLVNRASGNEAPDTSNNSSSSSNNFVLVDAAEITDEEAEASRNFVQLSASETRPVRSSGSGEEDRTAEEPCTFSRVSVPASSINVYSQMESREVDPVENVDGEFEDDAVEEDQEDHQEEDDREEGDQQEDERSEHEQQQSADGDRDPLHRHVPDPTQSLENEEDVEEDDLPEADMLAEDDAAVAQAILAHLENQPELAGDANVLPEASSG